MSRPCQVAVVTGAARGIGAATVRKFLASDYRVIGVDVAETNSDSGSAAHDEYEYQRCDVAVEDDVHSLVHDVVRRHRTVDVLVNVAGIVLVKPLQETTWDEYKRVVDVNLGGAFLMCKYVLPIMQQHRHGAIVNVGSVSGHVGQVDHALYGATKGAVIALSRALAWEVAPFNIRVNSVSPGLVDTPMLRSFIEIESQRTRLPFETIKAEREAEQALRRLADPSEIAEAIYFMASEGASFITGTDLLVDSGWVAK